LSTEIGLHVRISGDELVNQFPSSFIQSELHTLLIFLNKNKYAPAVFPRLWVIWIQIAGSSCQQNSGPKHGHELLDATGYSRPKGEAEKTIGDRAEIQPPG
jgi:hypothetical protein